MSVKLLTEHHLEVLSLKGGCRGSSESTLVKMSSCLKSHAAAQFYFLCCEKQYIQVVYIFKMIKHLWHRSETCHDDTR